MSSQSKIVAALVAVIMIVLAVSMRWPLWVSILSVLGGCGVILAAAAIARGKAAAPPPFVYQPPPPPAPEPQDPAHTLIVQGVNLASAWPDYEFIFDVTVYWRLADRTVVTPHVRPGATAVDMIIRRAAEVAKLTAPVMSVRLQHRLNDVLGVVETDRSGRIEVWADQARTTLSDQDAERLRTLSGIRKDAAVWEHQRRYESDRRDYLTNDVLKSTGSAVVWWLSRNESSVTQAVDLIGTMARLSAAARNEEVSELFRHLLPSSGLPTPEPDETTPSVGGSFGFGSRNGFHSVTDLVTALMDTMALDNDGRALFAERLAMDMAAMGDAKAAERIRDEFDVITEEVAGDQEPEDEPATETESG